MRGRLDIRRRWLVRALIVAATAAPVPAHAQGGAKPPEIVEAEQSAERGYQAYLRHDYAAAVEFYARALSAAPSAAILYNLARIYDTKIRDRELAARFYRRYIAEPGAKPELVRIANERLAVLRELERADAAARRPAVEALAQNTEHKRRRRLSGLEIAGISTGLVGLAGVGVGTAFGLIAKSHAEVAKDQCDGNDCTSQRGLRAAEDGTQAATISTASFVAGGALVVAGLTMFLCGRRAQPQRDAAALHFTPFFAAGTVGTRILGSW